MFLHILEEQLNSDVPMDYLEEEDYFECAIESLQSTGNDFGQFLKQDIEKYDREKTKESAREHHPEWFKSLDPLNEKDDGGINEKFRTKEDYFNNNFENRIKKFFKSQKKHKKQKGLFGKLGDNLGEQYQKKLQAVKDEFHQILESMKSSRRYFDRKSTDRMCSDLGEFKCEKYSKGELHNCISHFLNPYRSRGERLLFGSWTLDHM